MSSGKTPFAWAIVSGILLFFSAPGPAGFGLLAWTALLPLFWAIRDETPQRAARLGLTTGMIYHTLLLYWILIVLGKYGDAQWWIALPALLLLALYMSVYTLVFAAVLRCLRFLPLFWTAPLVWVSLDQIQSWLFTGFPWQDLGYSLYRFPVLTQFADLAGHHGITFVIVMVNAIIASLLLAVRKKTTLIERKSFAALLPALLLVVFFFAYNFWRYQQVEGEISTSGALPVTIVQGNVPQDQKWDPKFQKQTVDTYQTLSARSLSEQRSSLLIWPETALPFYPLEHPLFLKIVDQMTTLEDVYLLTGAPHRVRKSSIGEALYFNSAFLISPSGEDVGRYDKQHLVPFGEYIPFRSLLKYATPIVETLGDFSPGRSSQPLAGPEAKIGVLICFESIFPELARKEVELGAGLLVNITNDAWFGKSSAPWQHLSMAVLRAVENRRSLARAANTGISAFIDPLGRLTKTTQLFVATSLNGKLPLLTEESFFVRYGHRFGLLCPILLVLMIIFAKVRSSKKT